MCRSWYWAITGRCDHRMCLTCTPNVTASSGTVDAYCRNAPILCSAIWSTLRMSTAYVESDVRWGHPCRCLQCHFGGMATLTESNGRDPESWHLVQSKVPTTQLDQNWSETMLSSLAYKSKQLGKARLQPACELEVPSIAIILPEHMMGGGDQSSMMLSVSQVRFLAFALLTAALQRTLAQAEVPHTSVQAPRYVIQLACMTAYEPCSLTLFSALISKGTWHCYEAAAQKASTPVSTAIACQHCLLASNARTLAQDNNSCAKLLELQAMRKLST